MTPDEFRSLALSLPNAVEDAHMGHPDFRVGGKIFATLGYPDAGWAMVKLSPEEQSLFVRTAGRVFQPVPGGWGRQGCTNVALAQADEESVMQALTAAWNGRSAKKPSTKRKAASTPKKRSPPRRRRN